MNNEIGLPLTLLRMSEGHEVAVLEMGFYVPGEIALLCDLALPKIGVITNIGTFMQNEPGHKRSSRVEKRSWCNLYRLLLRELPF